MQAGLSHQSRVLRALPSTCLTLSELVNELELTNRQVCNAAAGLISKGLAERVEIGCYRLTPEGVKASKHGLEITHGPQGPISTPRPVPADSMRQRAWNVMRIQGSFTIKDLLMSAARGTERNPAKNLRSYCHSLAKAGILRQKPRRVAGTHPTSNGFVKYQLIDDIGEIAPQVRLSKNMVFDHNSGREFAL